MTGMHREKTNSQIKTWLISKVILYKSGGWFIQGGSNVPKYCTKWKYRVQSCCFVRFPFSFTFYLGRQHQHGWCWSTGFAGPFSREANCIIRALWVTIFKGKIVTYIILTINRRLCWLITLHTWRSTACIFPYSPCSWVIEQLKEIAGVIKSPVWGKWVFFFFFVPL